MSAAVRLLATIEARGGTVRTDGDRIGVRPAGVLDDGLRAELQAHKAELLDLLRGCPVLSLSRKYTATPQHPEPADRPDRDQGLLVLDAEELRHRYDERAGVYQFDGGLPRPEAELRAWVEAALDVAEGDPAINALGNAEARAAAARVLHAAGIPEPAAIPLRLVAAPAPRRDEAPGGYTVVRVLDNGLAVLRCEKCGKETAAGPRFHRCRKGGPS